MEGISIKYVDHMGDDFRVFEAAKATMGGDSESNFKRGETDPTRLINFLVKNQHWSPLRHPQVTFECEAPIAIARQLGKHQIGMTWNERSMRYRDSVIDVFYPDMLRGRPESLHNGSTDVDVSDWPTEINKRIVIEGEEGEDYEDFHSKWVPSTIKEVYADAMESALFSYDQLIKAGLAPEQARFILPQGMITRWIWTGSLLGWFNLYKQRSTEHAQYEVRDFANQLDTHMTKLFPISWEALKTHQIGNENVQP